MCPPLDAAKSFGDLAVSFELPVDEKIEVCHPADVGLAMSNAIANDRTIDKVLLLGGGAKCRHTAYELMSRYLVAAGVGALPTSAYTSKRTIPGGWVNTEESQALLSYQRHTLDDIAEEMKRNLGLMHLGARLFAPLIRRWMLMLSPYHHNDQA